uniref:Phospholipid phosphatase 2 n=1 Tax=Macaca mulatta TaxID=9544 RepID=A0A1D5QAL3_MACMU
MSSSRFSAGRANPASLPSQASSLGRQSPRVVSCLEHSLCPGEPGLQTTAVVSMGSGDHQFNLAEILSQNYSVQGECEEASRCPEKPKEELEKDFISQSNDMPFDELLALYGYEASDPISDRESEGGDVAPDLPDMTLDKEQIAKDLLSGEEEEETQSSADDLTPSVTSHEASDLFPNRSGSHFLADEDKEPGSSASSDTEEDSLPANKCKKEIMVGPQFQADLSNLHLNRHCEKIYENEDQLLWDPSVLPEREVEEFLYRAVKRRWQEMAGPQLPEGEAVKDSEQALYELVKCNFNVEEALRRLRFNVKVIRDGLCAWSEEECRNFEHGFRVHGKNFHLIQANKVRTRSVGECVEYYYLWKKSERYDYFAQQTRLGRRKYVPSGTTDADQDLDGSDPDGPGRPRPEQDALTGMRTASLPFAILTLVNAPYKRGFYCGDDSIRYPYRPDTITHGVMAGVTTTATVVLVSAGEAYLVYTDRLYSRSDFNNYVAAVYKVLGAFLFGAAVSQSLTDLAKYMIGRLRPNFLAVCDPDWSRVNCSVYVQLEKVCRGNPADVTEARLSFYSGHSSFGMYCMLFLALYVQARLCWKWARLLRPTVQFFLVAFALYVGYTRVSDYKHHWSDVLVGLLQGALVAGLTVSL